MTNLKKSRWNIIVVMLMLFCSEAQLSSVPNKLSLQQLVMSSQYIFVVKVKSFELLSAGKPIHKFELVSVEKGNRHGLKVGEVIAVHSANEFLYKSLAKMSQNNEMPMPMIDEYNKPLQPELFKQGKGTKLILFLKKMSGNPWQYFCEGGYEEISKLAQVQEIIGFSRKIKN